MSLTQRRFLYLIFIAAFFVATPLIIFYANGYKLSLDRRFVVKTGALIVDSQPRGATIILNNNTPAGAIKKYFSDDGQYNASPSKIKGLLPGEYEIKLELDNYWPWQKKLTIKPGESTYAEDIVLFKKELPLPIFDYEIKQAAYSPNGKLLITINDNEANLINLDNDQAIRLATTSPSTNNYISWAPSSKKAIVNNLLINTARPENSLDLKKIIGAKAVKLKWDEKSDDKLYWQGSNNLYGFNISTNTSRPLLPDPRADINDYLVKDKYIYLLSPTNKSSQLLIYEEGGGAKYGIIELPKSDNYEFINPDHSLINLYDRKYQVLYLINPQAAPASPLREIIANLKYAKWVNQGKLLYANDFEIWLYDHPSGKKTLLTRISQPIINIFWHPSNNYIIYSTAKAIYGLELDEREKHNITELIKVDQIDFSRLSDSGKVIYFYAKIGKQKSVYKMAIQ